MGKNIVVLLCILLLAWVKVHAQPKQIDLSGKWQFAIDSINAGIEREWFNTSLPLEIHLPGTTDEAGYGELHIPGNPTYNGFSEIRGLVRKRHYIGSAWYRKTITLDANEIGSNVNLVLERAMWQTKLWVNGKYAGEQHSLAAPHQFNITKFLKEGKNTLALLINNSPYVHLGTWSHGYSSGIQSIWNGAVGDIKLLVNNGAVFPDNIQVYASWKKQKLNISGTLVNINSKPVSGKIKYEIKNKSGETLLSYSDNMEVNATSGFQKTIELDGKLEKWDEFTPNLYTLFVTSTFDEISETKQIKFGVRDVESVDGRFVINGNKIFMRGEHDAGSFPLTGYPSMKKEDWQQIFKTGIEHGLNHWRFHSWCPPRAAFEAADEMGIYLQAELTLFSQDWENTLIGQDAARDAFLFEELERVLDTYGNHPSFVLMCMGNELRGDHTILEDWVAWGKNHDPRHLYAGNANLEAMRKYKRLEGDEYQVAHAGKIRGKRVVRRMYPTFDEEVPNTENDYSHTLKPPFDKWPIIAHETGQWTVFPDFSEIEKYKGIFMPRNFEVFKSRLEQKGMFDQANDFMMASGKLSALLYREEMERALRTPDMGGFQLLDLRDYQAQGTALIGVLNSFWESKGFITAEAFRESCNESTLLLKMSKRVWLNNEEFEAELVLPNYTSADIDNVKVNWTVFDKQEALFSGTLTQQEIKQGEVNSLGTIRFSLSPIKEAKKLRVNLWEENMAISNNYDIWIYPDVLPDRDADDIIIAKEATEELLEKIRKGAKVLLVPDGNYDAERMTFTTPFWSTVLFDYQVKTLGILCEPEHPVFADFPTDYYSNWQWWDLLYKASVVRLNHTPRGYKPVLQVIDHPVRNDKLGAIVECSIGKGKLLVTTLDILSDLKKRPVARQLKYSILNYMNSPEFDPEKTEGIEQAFFNFKPQVAFKTLQASDENSEYPIAFAFDGDEKTYWQSLSKKGKVIIEMEFAEERYITACTFSSGMKNNVPGDFKVFVTNDKEDKGDVVISGNVKETQTFEAVSWDNGFTIQKGKKGRFVFVEFEKVSDVPIVLNELNLVFGD